MKIAVVCDWLVNFGGAERVLSHIIDCYPNADLYAVVDFLDDKTRLLLKNKPIKTTFIQKFPFAKKYYRSYLPWMPLAIEQLDLSGYDLVISNSHAIAKGVLTGPNQVHISYVHSPMRYAWDMQHQYLRESGLNKGLKGYLAQKVLHKMRLWDLRTANGVDHFIANSNYIARRINKCYRREATVIYPPVETGIFTPYEKKDNYYLTASRMVPYKKMDLIVETFANLSDKKLIVIGDGPDMKKIKAKAASNIEILGFLPENELKSYLQRAKAFVFAAEEDFGLVPLEAQACGTPVIAFGKGGALETVRGLDHLEPTGVFFAEQTRASLKQAINTFENHQEKFKPQAFQHNLRQFTPENFKQNFIHFIDTHR